MKQHKANSRLQPMDLSPMWTLFITAWGLALTSRNWSRCIQLPAMATAIPPAEVVDTVPLPRWGQPELSRICTSLVERQNLSIRMGMRRMTRLTNAFSKKWENLNAAYALWFAFYNFCRVHQTLRVTPAMEARITDHVWSISEIL